MTIWTTPKTWTRTPPPTADDYNTHVRDNLDYLFSLPNFAVKTFDEAADWSGLNATSFADVDATDLVLTLTTYGGPVWIGLDLLASHDTAAGSLYLDFEIDGVRFATNDGITRLRFPATTDRIAYATLRPKLGLATGTHIIKLQYKTLAGAATIYGGAGTSNHDVHGAFYAWGH